MGVMMQAFHWNCPAVDGHEYQWWEFVRSQIAAIKAAGFTALWVPPAHKAANLNGPSMGYDPYDYYDLGEFNQKGRTETWFGSKQALLDLINEAHAQGLQVIADMVINHNSGADGQELNPFTKTQRWTRFTPASKTFPRNGDCFHPARYETWDDGTFGDMPDLCHRNPFVYDEILKLAKWLVETIGFDGFRYDFVKGYGSWIVTAIQESRYERNGQPLKPYGVGERWDSSRSIENWVNEINAWSDNDVGAFDFPLRDMLRGLCDSYGFDL
jgi:alpha-amylase